MLCKTELLCNTLTDDLTAWLTKRDITIQAIASVLTALSNQLAHYPAVVCNTHLPTLEQNSVLCMLDA